MDKYFLFTIALIFFSILIILSVLISSRIPKDIPPDQKLPTGDVDGVSDVNNKVDEDNDSTRYDNVSKSRFISNDPLRHLKSSNHLTTSDFTLLE
jgi:hypothetical protein